jgi:hypothetical protein
MTYSPVSAIIGIPAAGMVIGLVLSYLVRRFFRSLDLQMEVARAARAAQARHASGVVYAQPTSIPVDAFTRIAMTVKTKNISIRLDGGKYAFPPLELGHASAG